GLRWISRGFWLRDGELIALASLDEAAGCFGPGLELHGFRFDPQSKSWQSAGVVFGNAINNFPPKKLPTGEWMMSRRTWDYKTSGVHFLIGGLENISQWESCPVVGSNRQLVAEEPCWWTLPGDEYQVALFRDNQRSYYLHRSF